MFKLEALFEGQELSTEFKTKLSSLVESIEQEKEEKFKVIYEAKIEEEKASLQEAQEKYITEEVIPHYEALTESYFNDEVMPVINDYIQYAVTESIEKNKVQLQESFKVEVAESFLTGMANLYKTHNIDIPEGDNIISESKNKVVELQRKLNESTEKIINIQKDNEDLKKNVILNKVCSTLTESQVEKIHNLSSKISFISEQQFSDAIEDIKTNLGLISESISPTSSEIKPEVKEGYLHELISLALK